MFGSQTIERERERDRERERERERERDAFCIWSQTVAPVPCSYYQIVSKTLNKYEGIE